MSKQLNDILKQKRQKIKFSQTEKNSVVYFLILKVSSELNF